MGETEDEMPGWHHQLNEHELEQIPGDSEGQESLVCCSLWDHKESNMTKTEEQQQQQHTHTFNKLSFASSLYV